MAERVETAAERVEMAVERVETAAERVETAAERVETVLERVDTVERARGMSRPTNLWILEREKHQDTVEHVHV